MKELNSTNSFVNANRSISFGINVNAVPKRTFMDVWTSALKDNSMLYLLMAGVLSAYLDTEVDSDPYVKFLTLTNTRSQGFVEAIAIIASVILVVTMTAGEVISY